MNGTKRAILVLVSIVGILGLSSISSSTAGAVSWWPCKYAGFNKGVFFFAICRNTGPVNSWVYKRASTASKVTSQGTIKLRDSGTEKAVECKVAAEGTIGGNEAASIDETTHISASACTTVKGTCESPTLEAVNLPWKTELEEPVKGEVRDKITSKEKAPGWKISCAKTVVDTCEAATSVHLTNDEETGAVNAAFDASSAKAKCTAGGSETGIFEGSEAITLPKVCRETGESVCTCEAPETDGLEVASTEPRPFVKSQPTTLAALPSLTEGWLTL